MKSLSCLALLIASTVARGADTSEQLRARAAARFIAAEARVVEPLIAQHRYDDLADRRLLRAIERFSRVSEPDRRPFVICVDAAETLTNVGRGDARQADVDWLQAQRLLYREQLARCKHQLATNTNTR